jgi:hypothetical protein
MKKLVRFIWPALFVAIGIVFEVVAIVSFIRSLPDMQSQEIPILAPGETTFTITRPGDCTLWNETKTVIDGQFMTFPNQLPAGVTITIIKLPEGTRVPLRNSHVHSAEWTVTGNGQLEASGRSVAIGDVTFASPGQYEVVVTGLTDKCAFDLSQPMILHGISKAVVISLMGVLCFFAAIVWTVYAFVRLFRSKG